MGMGLGIGLGLALGSGGGASAVISGLTNVQDAWVWDNSLATATGVAPNDYLLRDPQSRVVIQTQSGFDGSLTIKAVGGGGPAGSGIDIFVDGVYNQTTQHNSLGVSTTVVATIPTGSHLVEIQEGQAHLQAIGANSFVVTTQPAPRYYLIEVGDSITAAANASPEYLGHCSFVRRSGAFDGVQNYGHSGFSLTSYQASDNFDTFVASMAARRRGTVRNYWLVPIGTNDYGITSETPTSYAALAVTMMTKLHTAYPSDVFAFQTAILRFAPQSPAEGANAGGFTHQQYRDAVVAALATNCPWVTVDHGELIAGLTDGSHLTDGLHPDATGHQILGAHNIGLFGRVGAKLAAQVTTPTASIAATVTGSVTPKTIILSVNILSWVRGDGVHLTTGKVDTWIDQNGTSHDFVQPTGAAQPGYTVSDSTLNNRGTLQGDGVAVILKNAALGHDTSVKPIFVWAVFKPKTFVSNSKVFGPDGGPGVGMRLGQTSTGNVQLLGGTNLAATVAALGVWKRGEFYMSGTNTGDYEKVGATKTTGSLGTTGANTGFDLFGAKNTGFGNFDIAEIVICDGLPNGTEITNLNSYATGYYLASLIT